MNDREKIQALAETVLEIFEAREDMQKAWVILLVAFVCIMATFYLTNPEITSRLRILLSVAGFCVGSSTMYMGRSWWKTRKFIKREK